MEIFSEFSDHQSKEWKKNHLQGLSTFVCQSILGTYEKKETG